MKFVEMAVSIELLSMCSIQTVALIFNLSSLSLQGEYLAAVPEPPSPTACCVCKPCKSRVFFCFFLHALHLLDLNSEFEKAQSSIL